MPELLRPPSHRGPLIAAGATVLTVGVVLQQLRISDLGDGWQLLITGALAGLFLWLATATALEGGRPPAYQSVLIVCGLVQLAPALLNLAKILGADPSGSFKPGTATWITAVLAGTAGLLAARRNSGIAAFLCAVAAGAALLSLSDWLGDPGIGAIRTLLLLLAVAYAIVSLVLRGSRPRHSEQLVNAAGLAILIIPLVEVFKAFFSIFGGQTAALPGFWEVVVAAAGFGLIAYAAADRAPGPAYLGVANLAAFVAVVSLGADRTLRWWPFVLLMAGAVMLLAALRPARPLPPEPDGYTRDDLPLTARVEGEDRVFTVRD